MQRIACIALVSVVATLAACKREEPPSPPLTPPQPQADANEARLHSEYAQQFEERLAQIEKGIDQLAAGAKTAATATAQGVDAAIVEMQELTAKTKAKAAELQTATGEKWEQTKAESERLMARLSGAYQAAKEKLVSDAPAPEAP
jgi:hypothetical protein